MIVINPGSENKGGTLDQAKKNAKQWLQNIRQQGILDVEMTEGNHEINGNFEFIFKHKVTKKEATLKMHGFTDKECKEFLFHPRIYWNGSSTAVPKIEDWLAEGFSFEIVYFKKNK